VTGRRYERRLVNELDGAGFEVVKSPSSGSGTGRDQPDLLAGSARTGLVVAVEAKSTRKDAYTVEEAEADQLERFAEHFGAEPVVAVYWKGPPGGNKSYGGWWFRRLGGVRRSPSENAAGGHHLRPRREDRTGWASVTDLARGRLEPERKKEQT